MIFIKAHKYQICIMQFKLYKYHLLLVDINFSCFEGMVHMFSVLLENTTKHCFHKVFTIFDNAWPLLDFHMINTAYRYRTAYFTLLFCILGSYSFPEDLYFISMTNICIIIFPLNCLKHCLFIFFQFSLLTLSNADVRVWGK